MAALRKRLERATEDMLTLRNENLELYRRLRVVRASSRAPALPGTKTTVVDFDPDGNYISGKNTPSKVGRGPRRDVASSRDADEDIPFARVDGDALDRKYLHLYEEKIDPFRLEELDRASVLARMNFLERGLAFTAKVRTHDGCGPGCVCVCVYVFHALLLPDCWCHRRSALTCPPPLLHPPAAVAVFPGGPVGAARVAGLPPSRALIRAGIRHAGAYAYMSSGPLSRPYLASYVASYVVPHLAPYLTTSCRCVCITYLPPLLATTPSFSTSPSRGKFDGVSGVEPAVDQRGGRAPQGEMVQGHADH